MRRILVDRVFDGTMVDTPFPASTRIPGDITIHAGNKGRNTLKIGCERAFDNYEFGPRISVSGTASPYEVLCGARFTVRQPVFYQGLEQANDDDKIYSPLGKESHQHVQRTWALYTVEAPYETWDEGDDLMYVKMRELEHARDADKDYGAIGIMVAVQRVGTVGETGTFQLAFWRCELAHDVGITHSGEWRQLSSATSDIGYITTDTGDYITPVSADICELPDGTLVLVHTIDMNRAVVYKSYDHGERWTKLSEFWLPHTFDDVVITLESIGWNLVLGMDGGYTDGVLKRYTATQYSADLGYSWNSGTIFLDEALVVDETPKVDMLRLRNGSLMFVHKNNADVSHWVFQHSFDGLGWKEIEQTYAATDEWGVSLSEDHAGMLVLWTTKWNDSTSTWSLRGRYTTPELDYQCVDTDPKTAYPIMYSLPDNMPLYLGLVSCCTRYLNRGGFMDLAYIARDLGTGAPGGTYTAALSVVRTAMWDGIVIGRWRDYGSVSYPFGYSSRINWFPICWPSSSDSNPHTQTWTRTHAGTVLTLVDGQTAQAAGERSGYLRMVRGGPLHSTVYSYSSAYIDYSAGSVIRVGMKVVDGFGSVYIRASNVALNIETEFRVDVMYVGGVSTIRIWDIEAGAEVASYTPTNWGTNEWNWFTVVYLERSVSVYRCPGDYANEYGPTEEIFAYDLLATAVCTGNGIVGWGVWASGSIETCDVRWRMAQWYYCIDHSFTRPPGPYPTDDPETDQWGALAVSEDCGIGAGLSLGFHGGPAIQDDEWSVESRFIYDTRNLLTPSPSIMWQEPEQSVGALSPQKTMIIIRPDDLYGSRMRARMDAFAMFGRNFCLFKIDGVSINGAGVRSYTTLFDTGYFSGDKAWLCEWEVAQAAVTGIGVDKNVIGVWPRNPAPGQTAFRPMTPGMFASDGWRNYYVYFTGIEKPMFKIIGNTEDTLELECNVEDYGIAEEDEFVIFGTSFFHEFASPGRYEGYRLTIYSQERAQCELAHQLGTLIVGEIVELPDDEWGYAVSVVPAVASVRGRTGYEHTTEIGRQQRIISLKYTGLIDRAPGSVGPTELYRYLRSGECPLVWVDDITPLTNNSDAGIHEPILARIQKGPTVTHAAYTPTDDGDAVGMGQGQIMRGVVDVGEMTLAEVL